MRSEAFQVNNTILKNYRERALLQNGAGFSIYVVLNTKQSILGTLKYRFKWEAIIRNNLNSVN